MKHKSTVRALTLAIVTLPLALSVTSAAQSASVAAQPTGDLQKVAAHLQAVTSMTANFSQTDRRNKTLNGWLTLKRPGKIRFQYQKGVPLLIVGDGKALTMIDYQVKQVQRWPIGKSPLSVLLNPAGNIASVARIVPVPDGRIVLVEARDPKKPEFGTLTLAFVRNPAAPGGLMLQGWVARDAQNNRTTIRLTNQKFNVPVADGNFRYTDPTARPGGR